MGIKPFTCPECGEHDMERLLRGVVETNTVGVNDKGELFWGDNWLDYDCTEEYEYCCRNCGWHLPTYDDYDDYADLIDYLNNTEEYGPE